MSKHRKTVKVRLPAGVTVAESVQLEELLEKHVSYELRRVRREFRVGDDVIDIYGRHLVIRSIDIYDTPTTYELYDYDGDRYWKAATEDKILKFAD